MPELPEVQTTVNGLREHILGLKILDVWSNYNSHYFKGSKTIKDPVYFKHFKREVIGSEIIAINRRAKNVLIHTRKLNKSKTAKNTQISGDSMAETDRSKAEKIILVHMKMTGHLLYGRYHFDQKNKKDPWTAIGPASLKDPFNAHIRFILSFSNGKCLALSDVRRFAKVALVETNLVHESEHLNRIGPEPLEKSFDFGSFEKRLTLRPNGKIKQVLMDQSIIAGIGNIYADESLWHAGIHPTMKVSTIKKPQLEKLFRAIKMTLTKGINFGGDSTSDYRNVLGEKGEFHETHHAYQRTGTKCDKIGCKGIIRRMVLGGRATHYCDVHQKM